MASTIKLLSFYFLLASSIREVFAQELLNWTHEIDLEDGVTLKWSTTQGDFVTAEITVPVQGYIALGFSRNLDLVENSDVIVAWLAPGGIPRLEDSHVSSDNIILEDEQKDYQLISIKMVDNSTILRFRREWTTCDPERDVAIGDDTTRIFWAYGTQTLFDRMPYAFLTTANFSEGASLYMKLAQNTRPDGFPDTGLNATGSHGNVSIWDLSMENVFVNSRSSSFWCKLFKFPRPEVASMIVGFRPILSEETKDNVHKMVVYRCKVPVFQNRDSSYMGFEQLLQEENQCYKSTTPKELSYCTEIVIAWGRGSQGEMFPEHVGMPAGGSSELFFKLEVQYFNTERVAFSDSSGLRLYYTPEGRALEAATLSLGHRATPFHLIPYGQDHFTTYSVCPQDCTGNNIDPVIGIRAFAIMLDAHTSATSIKVRHVRDGRELEPIIEESNFDPKNYQYRLLKGDQVIFPRDQLLMECSYNTFARDRIIFGGPEDNQELCQAVLMYYPRTQLTDCRSQLEIHSFFKPFGIVDAAGYLLNSVLHLPYEDYGVNGKSVTHNDLVDDSYKLMATEIGPIEVPFDFVHITQPSSYAHQSVGEHIRLLPWHEMKFTRHVQAQWRDGEHTYICQGSAFDQIGRVTRYPRFRRFKSKASSAKSTCHRRSKSIKKDSALRNTDYDKLDSDSDRDRNDQVKSFASEFTVVTGLVILIVARVQVLQVV